MDKKGIFEMKIVKKGLVFVAVQYGVLKLTYYQCLAHAKLKLLNRMIAFFCF